MLTNLRVVLMGAAATLMAVNLAAQDRLPPIPFEKMTDAQKKAATEYKARRGTELTGPPWSVLLRVPDYVVPALDIRLHNQRNSALNPKLTEFAILIASAHFSNNFEWNAHVNDARKAGLSQPVIDALKDRRRPENMTGEESVIYDFSTELLHNYAVSDGTYNRALAAFGEAGVVEAASLEGYYAYLALVMNAARSPLPPGAKPELTPLPANQ